MKWIKISDQLPPEKEDILVIASGWHHGGVYSGCFIYKPSYTTGRKHIKIHPEEKYFAVNTACCRDTIDIYQISYWMPIPEMPKDLP